MLTCRININSTPDNVFDCGNCNKCEPTSILNYPFEKDLKNSTDLVQKLKIYIENNTALKCKEPEIVKNPDIRVVDITLDDFLICRIEAKYLEGKAFVKASKIIGLRAKETLVVDEPKLLHYFDCKINDFKTVGREIPIFVVWKFDRPCEDIGGITVFQEVDILKDIYTKHKKRYFERESAITDFVNGAKKGVTRKYHFSIKETRPIWQLLPEIFNIAESHGLWQLSIPRKEALSGNYKTVEQNALGFVESLPICIDCKKPFTPRTKDAPRCISCWKDFVKTKK